MDTIKSNDSGLRELALFAGGGGGILGGLLLGWRTVCAVEVDEYARSILVRRQNDGHLAPFPIWDDVRTFDGRPWRGCVDVVSGGFPCQDISAAGKGAGIDGARSGLWGQMARIVSEVRPQFVWVENSPLLVSRGLGLVLSDLAKMGYHARWGIVGADDAGAPHRRKRIWILGYSDLYGQFTSTKPSSSSKTLREKQTRQDDSLHLARTGSLSASREDVAHSESTRLEGHRDSATEQNKRPRIRYVGSTGGKVLSNADSLREQQQEGIGQKKRGRSCNAHSENVEDTHSTATRYKTRKCQDNRGGDVGRKLPPLQQEDRKANSNRINSASRGRVSWWDRDPADCEDIESRVGRLASGVAHRVDRMRALGNGQVPAVVALAWNALSKLE